MDEALVKQQFKLHLPGLLKVLAEHLYSTKTVAVRELLQNAHDSCLRRSFEDRSAGVTFTPRIDLRIDPHERVLVISDNGAGLTAAEVEEYLATIGRSYTRELRDKASLFSPEHAAQLIGQFGFGFLSAFLIADRVTLTTRSFQPGSTAIRWESTGDEHYELMPGERDEVGTTIELLIKPSASFVLHRQPLIDTVRTYADLLPTAVHLDGDPARITLGIAPWDTDNREAATAAFIARRFHFEDPLAVIHLTDHRIELGHDGFSVPLKGFIAIPPHTVASLQEYGDLVVFIRGMFIRDGEKELLPGWARFVRGVVDCPLLQPTASREELHQDDRFAMVKQAIEEQLSAGLQRIAHHDPITWRKIIRGHTDLITAWAVTDDDFFNQVADVVSFRTARGRLTLPEYLELTGDTVYYVTHQIGSLQDQLLAEGHDVPVIDASWLGVLAFLRKYVERKPGLRLLAMEGDAESLLLPVPDIEYRSLLEVIQSMGTPARVASFRPSTMPAILLHGVDVEFVREAREAVADGSLPDPIARLVDERLQNLADAHDQDMLSGTLYLNASCPLIQRLIAEPPEPVLRDATLRVILEVARLFSARALTPPDAKQAFREMGRALEELSW